MGKTHRNKIPYINLPGYKRAKEIMLNMNWEDERSLRSLAKSITGDSHFAYGSSYGALKAETLIMKDVIQKIAKAGKEKKRLENKFGKGQGLLFNMS